MIASSADSSIPRGATRHDELVAAARNIRVRRGLNLPVEQILLGLATILFPLGLIFIILGWEGAAHNGHTYAQIDYLISGGILGLGLSVAGGFMYFGYWLSRQLGESRRQSALTLHALQRLEDLLDASLNSRVDMSQWAPSGPANRPPGAPPVGAHAAPPIAAPAVAPETIDEPAPARGRKPRRVSTNGSGPNGLDATGEVPAATGPILYATPRGSLLHRAECPVVARRDDLRAVPAGSADFGYCTMCDAAGVLV